MQRNTRWAWPIVLLHSVLIGQIILGPLSALAQEIPQPIMTIAQACPPGDTACWPDEGRIDSFHELLGQSAQNAAIYALRTSTIRDLLKTRADLRTLLGGPKRVPEIDFSVPIETHELYLKPRAHVTDVISLIKRAQRDPEGINGPKLRYNLLRGLTVVAANLIIIDQDLKFLEQDYWNTPEIAKMVERHIQDTYVAPAMKAIQNADRETRDEVSRGLFRQGKREWLAGLSAYQNDLAGLKAMREDILEEYHLLGTLLVDAHFGKKDKAPIYRHIYAFLENTGFPRHSLIQTPLKIELPTPGESISLPRGFRNEVDQKIFDLLKVEDTDPALQYLYSFVSPDIDAGLKIAMKANTEELVAQSKEVHWTGSHSSPLWNLARFKDRWQAVYRDYHYFGPAVLKKLEQAQAQIEKVIAREDGARATRTKWIYGTGTVVAVGLTVVSFGAGAPILGGALTTGVLMGASGAMSIAATENFLFSRTISGITSNMYLGTGHAGSYAEMRDGILMTEDAAENLMWALVSLIPDVFITKIFSQATKFTISNGKRMIQLKNAQLRLLRLKLGDYLRMGKLSPLSRTLVKIAIRGLQSPLGKSAKLLRFKEAVEEAARIVSVPPRWIMDKFNKIPCVGKASAATRDRMLASPDYIVRFWRNQWASFEVQTIAEVQMRGLNPLDYPVEFTYDSLTNQTITGAMVCITADKKSATLVHRPDGTPVAQNVFEAKSASEAWNAFSGRAKQVAIVGLAAGAVSVGISEPLQMMQSGDEESFSEHVVDMVKGTAYTSAFMVVSSNLRFQLADAIEKTIKRRFPPSANRALILGGVDARNNYFGGLNWVQGAQLLHVEDSPAGEKLIEFPDKMDLMYRLEGGETPGSYLFDFLGEDQSSHD